MREKSWGSLKSEEAAGAGRPKRRKIAIFAGFNEWMNA
jgi:hypothetical protein